MARPVLRWPAMSSLAVCSESSPVSAPPGRVLALSPDGEHIAIREGGGVRVLDGSGCAAELEAAEALDLVWSGEALWALGRDGLEVYESSEVRWAQIDLDGRAAAPFVDCHIDNDDDGFYVAFAGRRGASPRPQFVQPGPCSPATTSPTIRTRARWDLESEVEAVFYELVEGVGDANLGPPPSVRARPGGVEAERPTARCRRAWPDCRRRGSRSRDGGLDPDPGQQDRPLALDQSVSRGWGRSFRPKPVWRLQLSCLNGLVPRGSARGARSDIARRAPRSEPYLTPRACLESSAGHGL
jgi:hypothetical protein